MVICSYWEVQKYERSASVSSETFMSEILPGHFAQYSADNVDHDLCTLDGKNTFHGMGIVASVTPKISLHSVVPRITVTTDDIARVGRINIKHYVDACGGIKKLEYEKLPDMSCKNVHDKVNLLWKL